MLRCRSVEQKLHPDHKLAVHFRAVADDRSTMEACFRFVQGDRQFHTRFEGRIVLDSDVLIYDTTTFTVVHTFPIAAEATRDLEIVDVDSDGALEFVLCDESGLYVYDALTGMLEYSDVALAAYHLEVGNVDSDAELEIVLRTPLLAPESIAPCEARRKRFF